MTTKTGIQFVAVIMIDCKSKDRTLKNVLKSVLKCPVGLGHWQAGRKNQFQEHPVSC